MVCHPSEPKTSADARRFSGKPVSNAVVEDSGPVVAVAGAAGMRAFGYCGGPTHRSDASPGRRTES